MTIEQKINWLYKKHNWKHPNDRILMTEWTGIPDSHNASGPLAKDIDASKFTVGEIGWMVYKIDELIKNTDDSECLTSNSEYIRECKKWLMENE